MATIKKTEDVKATTAKTETTAKVAEAKAAVKPAEKKTETKSTAKKTETKAAAKKAPAKKATTKKAPAKKAADAKTTVFVKVGENEFAAKSVVDKCVKAFKAENKGATIKTVEVYINANESKAYYVVNGIADGKFVEL